MSLQGYALTANPVADIACAYASSSVTLRAYDDGGRWTVIGSFKVPLTVRARLSVVGCVAGHAVCEVQLYNPAGMIESRVYVTAVQEQEYVSAAVDLVPGVLYQIAARVYTSGATNADFGVIRVASLRAI
jgi:hypothetical protein